MSDTAAQPKRTGVVRASALLAVAALVSRITGLLAKIVIIAVLSVNVVNDSYTLANTLPNIVFELLIGGVLTSVAIPLLARAQRTDPDGGEAYTQQLMTLASVGLVGATAVAVAAAPLLTWIYLSDDFKGDPALATHFAYLLLPEIFFYGMAALFGAILNSKERFAAPAWAPVANNILVIAVAIGLAFTQGGFHRLTTTDGAVVQGDPTVAQFLILGLGTTAGIVVQAAVMLPSLHRSGFRFKWRLKWDRRMGEAGGLAGWAVLYVLVSQVGYVVSTKIASSHVGGITTFSYANLLFQTPYGILGVSVLTAIMPRLSRHAAAGDMELVKDDVSMAGRLSAVALLPVSAAGLALAGALGVVATGYGNVSIESAQLVGITFAALSVGLLPLAMTLVQMRVFYAMKDGRTPVMINAIMVAVRVPLLLAASLIDGRWLIPGLAVATATSYLVGAVVGELWLRHRFGPMGSRRMLRTIGKMMLAAAFGGLAGWGAVQLIGGGFPDSFPAALGQLVVGGVIGIAVIGLLAVALRVEEFDPLIRRLRVMLRLGHTPAGSVTQTDIDLPDLESREQVTPSVSGDAGTPDDSEATRTSPSLGAVSAPADAEATVQTESVSAAASATIGPGAMVGGRYRLVSLVAVDASGNRFWRAKDTVLPRDMAVTLLPDGPNTNATVTRTLRAGRLHHIGLPQTLDLGTESGHSYVVGQWVDGATLTDLLAGGPLDGEVASSITAKVADAVAEAHRNGIALGAVHPSLVRVNFDGQVRLSHVISYPGASTDQDIRAIGGLLYLMLTGAYPLPQNGMSPALPVAPTSGGRELPADEAKSSAPAGLSALAERTLHPEGQHGVRSAAAIAALLHGADTTQRDSVLDGAEAPSATPSQLAERRLMRERRAKLSVAGVMLLALTVLLAIVVGSVIKRAVDSVQDPVITSDQRLDVTTTLAATSAEVPPPTGSGGQASVTGSAPPVAPVNQVNVPIVAGEVYDPQGNGQKDYTSYVDRVYDPDPTTAWQTFAYRQQFGPNGLKLGVGLLLTLDHEVSPLTVTVTTTTPTINVQIRASDGNINAAVDQTQVLASSSVGTAPAAIALQNAPTSKYLIVFVSGLHQRPDGDWDGSISNVTVTAAG